MMWRFTGDYIRIYALSLKLLSCMNILYFKKLYKLSSYVPGPNEPIPYISATDDPCSYTYNSFEKNSCNKSALNKFTNNKFPKFHSIDFYFDFVGSDLKSKRNILSDVNLRRNDCVQVPKEFHIN